MRLPLGYELQRALPRGRSLPEGVRMMAALPSNRREIDREQAGAEIGSNSDQWFDDLLPDAEENPELMGRLRYRLYDQMRLGDPTVRMAIWSMRGPLVGAEWGIKPAGANPVDRAVADYVAWNLGVPVLDDAMSGNAHSGWIYGGWSGCLAQSTLCLPYGSMSGELVWDEVRIWADADGEPHVVRPLWRVAPRYPHTIAEYRPPKVGQRAGLGGLRQDLSDRDIPGEKLLHHVLMPEDAPYTGVSLVRPAYTWWKLKKAVAVAGAVGFERWSGGIPEIRFPSSETGARQKANEIGRALRNHERAFVAFEGPEGNETLEGWRMKIHTIAGQLNNGMDLLGFYDQQIIASAIAEWLRIGTAARGSSEFGKLLIEHFYQVLDAIGQQIASDYSLQLIDQLVGMNFGAVDRPTMVLSRIQHEDVEAAAKVLTAGTAAGIRFDDLPTVNRLRRRAGLPPVEKVSLVEGTSPVPGGDDGPPRQGDSRPIGSGATAE